jgi:8-oxo-dGTP diphosphatase
LNFKKIDRVSDIDWKKWKPDDLATLLFIIRDGEMLLIRKKMGLGAGKINGPGGRMEPGETPLECAVREVEEELNVTASDIGYYGVNRFHFIDGYKIMVHIFKAAAYTGTPAETDEALPIWVSLNNIPYNEMWVDDLVWLPKIIDGKIINGMYIMDGDEMKDYKIELRDFDPDAVPE